MSRKQAEADVQVLFVKWKNKYLRKADFSNQKGKVGKYVAYAGGVEDMPTSNFIPITTSECHGWGMLILAHMDGAADGDFDMAYALLIADKQWGSSGKHNYKQIATNLIKALKKYYVCLKDYSKPFVAYYGESVRLINMIAYSGNWINP